MGETLAYLILIAVTRYLGRRFGMIFCYGGGNFKHIYSETIEIIHSRGVIKLLAIYKIHKLKYVFARYAIRL